jgi:aspartyl/asparaginyl beta-hydroxylase (cupin superfamily)
MVYDSSRLLLRDTINKLIPQFRTEFLAVHGTNTSDIPLYDTGKELDVHKKWRMCVLKNMGVWDNQSKTLYPTLNQFVEEMGDTCRSVGYSILEPGGNVITHTDTEENHEDYVIVHAPLIVPEGDVGFIENDERGKWIEGECFILDVESPHSIWNYTDKPRVVVLFELLKKDVYV